MKKHHLPRLMAPVIVIVLAAQVMAAYPQRPTWLYRPTGNDASKFLADAPDGPKSQEWRPVNLPHAFDLDQGDDNVNAWYVADVDVPETLSHLPLLLDLGIIDDADETYVNGHSVGVTGIPDGTDRFAGSAWQRDRMYLVSPEAVRAGANVIAVRVKDFTGIGGFLGQPFIGSVLPKSTCRYLKDDGDPAAYAASDYDDSTWDSANLPLGQRFGGQGYIWYRFRFDLPPGLLMRDIPLDLGRVFDVAEVYLNGRSIARCGEFPPGRFAQTGARLRVVLPREHLEQADNLLAVRVFNPSNAPQLLGAPALPLCDLDLFKGSALKSKDDEAILKLDQDRQLDLFSYIIHCGYADKVASLCAKILAAPVSPEVGHRAACLRVYALWLAGHDAEAWAQFCALDFNRHIPYETAAAMAAYCFRRGDPECGVLYRQKDLTTLGDWLFSYGGEHAILCAAGSPFDAEYGAGPRVTWKAGVNSPDERLRAWIGEKETGEKRALYLPAINARRYSSWDDRGEIRPFDEQGPDIVLDVSVPEGIHLLSLYFVDWDWAHTAHPRVQSIIVSDQQNHPLAVAATGRFGDGHYERFLVQGPRDLRLRITKQRSPCAVVSGVFLDAVPPFMVPPVAGPAAPETEPEPILEVSPEIKALRDRYAALQKEAEVSLLTTLCGDSFEQFEADVLEAVQASPTLETLWWAAECKRMRFSTERSLEFFHEYLERLRNELPADERLTTFSEIARLCAEKRFSAGAILMAMQSASAEKASQTEEYKRLVEESGSGALELAAEGWRINHPLARWRVDRGGR